MLTCKRSSTLLCVLAALCVLTTFIHALRDGATRLVCGEYKHKGTVQVYYDGQWGTICDSRWGSADASVVCRQLGYERSLRVYRRSHFCSWNDTVPIHLDGLSCRGSEQSILECSHSGWGVHARTCSHKKDAGVECQRKIPQKPYDMPVRLACPGNIQDGTCVTCPHKQHPNPEDCTAQVAIEGIVMALYNGEWKPITTEGWNMHSAHVVCGELGYPLALGTPTLEQLWPNWNGEFCKTEVVELASGSGDNDLHLTSCSAEEVTENDQFRNMLTTFYLKDIECNGREGKLLDCYFSEFGPFYTNSSLNVATVRCGYQPHQKCNPSGQEVYRTRGNAVPWKGRVEVNIGGEWGTVCDTGWTNEDANVICRAMGYGTAKHIFFSGFFGRGVGPIFLSDLKCKGNELNLLQCEGDTAEKCTHGGDAGVECNAPLRCKPSTVGRIVNIPLGPWYQYQFVEVNGPFGWGQVCSENLTLTAASVLCRENERRFLRRISSEHFRPGFSGVFYSGMIDCKGDEIAMEDCSVSPQPTKACLEGYAVVECTDRLPDLVPDLAEFEFSLKFYRPFLIRRPLFSLECALEENCLSSSAHQFVDQYGHFRTLLAFSSLTMNYGTADFYPALHQDKWIFHECHRHLHSFETFVSYDLLNLTTGERVAEGHKASFCLEDTSDRCESGFFPRYQCDSRLQGISINCGDLYTRHLDCQWIDITDVRPGTYILRQHINPDKLVMESDFTNNGIQCVVSTIGGPEFKYDVGKCERIGTS